MIVKETIRENPTQERILKFIKETYKVANKDMELIRWLIDSKTFANEEHIALFDRGALTINELRHFFNLHALPDGNRVCEKNQ